MKLIIDISNRSIRMVYHSVGENRLEWDKLNDKVELGTVNTGHLEVLGVGLEFDGTLDIRVVGRDKKKIDFLVVGDGLQ